MSSSVGTLYTPSQYSFNTRKALAVASYAGLSVDVAKDFTFGETNKSEDFLKKFPGGKIPALAGSDGFNLTEGAAIAQYFAALAPNSGLLGSDAKTQAKIAQWISFGELEINQRLGVANGMFNNFIPMVKPVYQNRLDKASSVLPVLEAHLATNTFLVGDRITLADIAVASILADGFSRFFGPEEQKKFPNTLRFEQTVINHPKIASAFEGVSLATAAAVYTPPKKEAAPTVPKAPKAEKPKAAPKPKEVDEEEEESFADVPAAKNPLDLLPKSTFVLDEWKRQYSNTDTRTEALPWLYENFDAEGYSIWKMDFKYNEELTLPFMSANQIGGFFTRLEGSRKYCFASAGVLGKTNDSIITGAVICRGKEFEPVMSAAPDWESYSFTPLSLSNEKDKEFLAGAFAWDLEIDGKAWADGKNFK